MERCHRALAARVLLETLAGRASGKWRGGAALAGAQACPRSSAAGALEEREQGRDARAGGGPADQAAGTAAGSPPALEPGFAAIREPRLRSLAASDELVCSPLQ